MKGYFVGDTGEEAFGTWEVGQLLDGAFGANRHRSCERLSECADSNGLIVKHREFDGDVTYSDTDDTIQIVGASAEFRAGGKTGDVFRLSQLYAVRLSRELKP